MKMHYLWNWCSWNIGDIKGSKAMPEAYDMGKAYRLKENVNPSLQNFF